MDINIYDLTKSELAEYLVSIGEPKYRADQMFQTVNTSSLPKHLRALVKLPGIEKELTSKDGTKKFLLKLADGALIECVLLCQDYGNTACISSQVGCKMGCVFCASGTGGFTRNLSAGEMLAQVLLLNSFAKLSNIVIMGMGEPFDNFDNTVKFLRLVTSPDGINIGARGISVSTVGLPDKIKQFADMGTQINLCISLHAPNDTVRMKILPVAKVYSVKQIIAAAKYFFEKTKRRVIFEYALINNVNCMEEHALELSKLLRGFPNHVNLINLNAGVGGLEPPPRAAALKFMDTLIKNGTSCTMRKSRGSDIEGACGQLKTKVYKMKKISNEQMRILRDLISGHRTVRYGTLQPDVYQTVENHTNRMLAAAPIVAGLAGLCFDGRELAAFILAHDLPELGMDRDVTSLEQAKVQGAKQRKDETEKQKKEELAKKYGKWLLNLFDDYDEQKSEVTRFIKWVDKYEASRHMLEIDLFSEIPLVNFNINTSQLVERALKIPAVKDITLKHLDNELRYIWERYDELDAFNELRAKLL